MNVSEFERKTGLSRDTLRYYEKIGVITAPKRGFNGYRHYSEVQLDEIAFIKKGQAIGFSLAEIKQGYSNMLKLGHLCPEFQSQLLKKQAQFRRRIKNDQKAMRLIEALLQRA